MKIRRLLVAACAAIALVLACATGEPRGAVAVDDESSVASATDPFEALPSSADLEAPPPPPGGSVYVDLHCPTSRMTTADVFRPPQA